MTISRRCGGCAAGAFDLAGVIAAIGPDEFKLIEALADAIWISRTNLHQ